jgi:hypothetical protein
MRTFYIKVLKNTYCARRIPLWHIETLSLTRKQNVYFMYRRPIYNALLISLLNSKLFCRKAWMGGGGRDIVNSLLPAWEGGGVVRGQSKFISTFLGPNGTCLARCHFRAQKSLDFQAPPLPMGLEMDFPVTKSLRPAQYKQQVH